MEKKLPAFWPLIICIEKEGIIDQKHYILADLPKQTTNTGNIFCS